MTDLLTMTTPTNLHAEREKFFASSTYHPLFHYGWQDDPVTLNPTSSKYKLYQAILNQDYQGITHFAKQVFATTITPEGLSQAQSDAELNPRAKHEGNAADFAKLLKEGFAEFNIDYDITISKEHGFNARPDHKNRRIIVSEAIHYELFSMVGGVHHDLVHIMRYLNGQHNNIKRSSSYLPTEEGLAAYCQDHVLGVVDNGLAQHALEYIGTSVGMEGNLRDIYNVMRDGGMSADLAWKRASRHKFGFVDTREPGDFIKPAMYYFNELKVGGLNTDEKLRLFVGKIALSELSQYPIYHGIWDSDKLIDYFNL